MVDKVSLTLEVQDADAKAKVEGFFAALAKALSVTRDAGDKTGVDLQKAVLSALEAISKGAATTSADGRDARGRRQEGH